MLSIYTPDEGELKADKAEEKEWEKKGYP